MRYGGTQLTDSVQKLPGPHELPVDRRTLVVAQRRKYARLREVEGELAHRFPQHVQIVRPCLVPDVVRRQVTRPDDEINVLKKLIICPSLFCIK